MMSVWEVSKNFLSLDALLEESAGELTPEIEENLATLVTEGKDALESAGNYRRWLEAQVQVCKDRRAALAATIQTTEAKLARLEEAMVTVLSAIGKPVKLPEFTLSTMTRNKWEFSATVPLFELPDDCLRYKEPELNKTYLNELKSAGQSIPAGLVAVQITTTSLTVRTPKKKEAADETNQ